MDIASIAQDYFSRFKARHAHSTTPEQWSALNAILGCRTSQYGQIYLSCRDCKGVRMCHQSCGHRSCNQCQNHSTTQWLDRQISKLLPVKYFMVTFTLPYELRALAKSNQKQVYSLLFKCAVSTLKEFGLNEKKFASELAMTAVLHTHTRKLDYHPHVHVVVPGGGIHRKRKEWRKLNREYLFNGFALSKVFKGKLLKSLQRAKLKIPLTPKKWVVQCRDVGRGLPALKYLCRYLYRGVISNKNIIKDDGTYVTFKYKDSKTKRVKTRRLRGEDFIQLVLQHTLPKGFRRARDYGFLHGNAKGLLKAVQWILQVVIAKPEERKRPKFICQRCQSSMVIVGFSQPRLKPG